MVHHTQLEGSLEHRSLSTPTLPPPRVSDSVGLGREAAFLIRSRVMLKLSVPGPRLSKDSAWFPLPRVTSFKITRGRLTG